jgi:hypothetical protein
MNECNGGGGSKRVFPDDYDAWAIRVNGHPLQIPPEASGRQGNAYNVGKQRRIMISAITDQTGFCQSCEDKSGEAMNQRWGKPIRVASSRPSIGNRQQ